MFALGSNLVLFLPTPHHNTFFFNFPFPEGHNIVPTHSACAAHPNKLAALARGRAAWL